MASRIRKDAEGLERALDAIDAGDDEGTPLRASLRAALDQARSLAADCADMEGSAEEADARIAELEEEVKDAER